MTDAAHTWLRGNKFIDQNQSLNLQLLVAKPALANRKNCNHSWHGC